MSNFKSFGQTPAQNKTVVKFFLNISKKTSSKETVAGYTHNGVIFCSPQNDSSWVQFRAVSDKQGWTPIELEHQGQSFAIDSEKFWTNMFSCEASELPDIKLKANIGDIDAADELVEAGGCLVIEADVTGLGMSDGEYKGETIVYFHLKVEKMYTQAIQGKTVDTEWIMSSLSNSVTAKSIGKDALSKYRRVAKPQPLQEMANTVNNADDAFSEDFDQLVDL